MLLTSYFRPEEPIDLNEYSLLLRIGGSRGTRRLKHSTLYAISKQPLHVPRRDGNPQHIRKDGRDERLIVSRNGEAILKLIERCIANRKTELYIQRAQDHLL